MKLLQVKNSRDTVKFINHPDSRVKTWWSLNIVEKVELKCPAENIPDNYIDLTGTDIGTSIKNQ